MGDFNGDGLLNLATATNVIGEPDAAGLLFRLILSLQPGPLGVNFVEDGATDFDCWRTWLTRREAPQRRNEPRTRFGRGAF